MFGGEEGETPTGFEGQQEASPFDEGAFGGEFEDKGFEPGGTPMPDFSPDTGMEGPEAATAAVPPPAPEAEAAVAEEEPKKPRRGGGGGLHPLIAVGIGIAAVILGIIAGGIVSAKVGFLPNPLRKEVADAQNQAEQLRGQVARLKRDIADLTRGQGEEGPTVTPEEAKRLKAEIEKLAAQSEEIQAQLGQLRKDREMIKQDIEAKNEQYIEAEDQYQELVNETSIVKARHRGLLAEVDRLTEEVGQLEDANARRIASKKALEHDIERLAIAVREGIPLTPEKYSRRERLQDVQKLREQATSAKWVTPALLDNYTVLYLRELEIAEAKEYFFARIPVTDKLGSTHTKWAECLMMGNRTVYYRTLDGKNIGVYENIADEGAPRYAFREDLPGILQKQIEEWIFNARVKGYEDKVRILAQKELVLKEENEVQRVFESL